MQTDFPIGKAILGGGLLLGILMVGLASSFTVHERERVVVTRNGAFQYVAGPGWHLKLPFLDSVETYPVGLRSSTLENLETFTTGDQPQEVHLNIVVAWDVPPANVERVFRLGQNVERQLLTMVQDRTKRIVGLRHATAIPTERGAIVAEILAEVRGEAERLFGITVLDVQLVNFDYSRGFRTAVDAAAQATQTQARARTEAQTAEDVARGQANAAIASARGAAQSRTLAAEAEANALRLQGAAQAENVRVQGIAAAENIRIQGRATAEAITAQAQALGQNPNYVAMRQAERWNGALPTQMLGGTPVPFLNLGAAR